MEETKIKKNFFDKLIDNSIDFIFSKDPRKWLILIVLLGTIIRFLVVSHVTPLADEMIHGTHAINFIGKGAISHMTQGPLWFYLTDIFYKLFGVNILTFRSLSFFFGTLTIIILYLLADLLFNKKIALISAFLLAVSPFFTRYALSYMDEAMFFFVLFAIYLFIKKFKETEEISLLSAFFLGLAMLIKIIAADFIIIFALFIFVVLIKKYKKDKLWIKKNYIKIILFFVIIFLLFSPVFVYNYLLYKDQGIVDLPFAMYLNINKSFYQGSGLAHDEGFDLLRSFSYFKWSGNVFWSLSPITFLLALPGIFLSFKYFPKIKKFNIFLIGLFASHYFILITAIALETHYVSFVPFFALFSAVTLFFLEKLFIKKFNLKKILVFFIILIFVINMFILWPYLTSISGTAKMRNYANNEMDKNSLVVADSRIYRGNIAWLFHDFHYLESSYFPQILEMNNNFQGQKIPTKVYFIECVIDDCGWGTVKAGGLNDSSEQLVNIFASQAILERTFYGGGGGEKNEPYFSVYSTTIELNPQIVSDVDLTHEWFFYPVAYKMRSKIYDNYTIHSPWDNLLNDLAYLVLIFSVFLALISPIILIYILLKEG